MTAAGLGRRDDLLLALSERVAPRHTVLLVVDMQNDFCGAGGFIERVIKKDAGACRRVAEPIDRLVAVARATGVPVLWLRANYEPSGLPENMRARLVEHGISDGCCIPGTWGYDWYGPRPAPNERIIEKRCYDGFVGTSLDAECRALGVRTILLSGVQTNVCVEATLRHAHALGYYCVVAEDCVASHTAAAHEATLAAIRSLLGDVVPLAEVARLWGDVNAVAS
ncbi:MAG TPA: isochorismatase family cysteine hydrolase [Alphaproteobacteria bacterium]|nr:isochorismatase family cysteine hydrolase [Alphaproteobacteria bacterium]